MSWVAVGVGGASMVGGIASSMNAASSAAKAQARAAAQYQQYVQGQMTNADNMIMNPAALAASDQSLKAQEHQVQRQEQLAQSINPALIEQGKQYMQLLQGQSAPVLKNLQDQRALQRQQLVQQLQTQMGPGAETSSAGMQQLNQFDQETANTMSQAQQQYTGMLGGMSLQAPGSMNAAGGANMQLNQMATNTPQAQAAKLNASFMGQGGAAQQAGVDSAGAGSAGQAIMGQALTGVGSSILGGAMGKRTLGNSINPNAPTGPVDTSGGQLTQNSGSTLNFT